MYPQSAPGWYPTPEGPRYWDGYRWVPPAQPLVATVTTPLLGWLMAAGGALVFVGSFMDWVSALGGLVSKSGVEGGGDGWITVVLGLAIIGLGIAIGCKQGLLGLTITTAILSAAAFALAIYEVSDIHRLHLEVAGGLYVISVGALAGVGLGIAGAFVRVKR